MDDLLLELMTDLEDIGKEHEELYDSEARWRMSDAVVQGFIDPTPTHRLPDELGMYSKESNLAVRTALENYIRKASARAEELGISAPADRLAAFQREKVKTKDEKQFYDDFFGYLPPEEQKWQK